MNDGGGNDIMNQVLRMLVSYVACAGIILLCMSHPVRADSFTVEDWDMGIGVGGNGDDHAGAAFLTPINPFVAQHAVTLPSDPATFAAAQYDISWLTNYGSFHIASQAVAASQASSTIGAEASGSLRFSVTEPLPLHIDSSWTYALPADWMMTQYGVAIGGESSQTSLFRQYYNRQTLPWEPSSGTLTIQGDVVLLPGETWRIQYVMNLAADAGPNHSAIGNGYVNLTITPEPASLAMMAPVVLLAFARRQRAASR
jgi:hypothetical protein